MRIRATLVVLWAAVAVAISSGAARAGAPVELKAQPAAEASVVRLGDLFDGAGRAGAVVVAAGSAEASSLVLDASQVQRLAHANGLDWDNPSGYRRIVVTLGAGASAVDQQAPVLSPGRKGERTVQVLTFTRSLAAGEIIQPQDLVWSKVQAHLAPADAAGDPDQAVGQAARRPIREGAPVAAHDLAAPVVIRRDEIVTVSYLAEGVELTIQGKAAADAALGQPVEVVNTQSRKSISAIAVGPGRAATGPAAGASRRVYATR